jgi:hypothetical protein
MKRSVKLVFAASLLSAASATSQAQVLASADFTTYSPGALVGQDGWGQFGTASGRPLTVESGAVTWTGGNTTSGQDAFLPFTSQITQPISGTTILHFDLTVSVSSTGSNPSYFAALNTRTDSTTSGNFQNARLVARAQDTGFVFGARVNGQSGYPFAYGTTVLDFDTSYAVRAEINLVEGNANDVIYLYVGNDFSSLTLHSVSEYSSGTVSDPSYGAIILAQFGSASINESGVSISNVSVTVVPEPSTYAAFLGLMALGVVAYRRRKL